MLAYVPNGQNQCRFRSLLHPLCSAYLTSFSFRNAQITHTRALACIRGTHAHKHTAGRFASFIARRCVINLLRCIQNTPARTCTLAHAHKHINMHTYKMNTNKDTNSNTIWRNRKQNQSHVSISWQPHLITLYSPVALEALTALQVAQCPALIVRRIGT